MVLVQQWPVFIVFFLSNVGQGNVFYDILEKKSLSRISKTRASKRRKNHIFPKGLTHGFGLTMSSFSIFFSFRQHRPENVFRDILERNNAFLGYKKTSSKSRNIDIFPKRLTHGFGPKMAFFKLFFLGNIGQENVFYDILQGKNAFLGYKKKKLKNSKN